MTYPYQVSQSSSETLDQQFRYSSECDKSGQHNTGCLFVNRISEPWPNKYIKYVLMEWYIYQNEKDRVHPPGPWDCPLLGCDACFEKFRDVITHLEDCSCLKPNIKYYTCPGCNRRAQVPAAIEGPGQRAMLKLTKSMESIREQFSPRSQPSSPGSSPTATSFSSNVSLNHAKELASPMQFPAEKPTLSMKIPPQSYELCCEQFGLTPATTSSYGTELPTPFSAQELHSASAFPRNMVTLSDSAWLELPCPDDPSVFPCASTTQSPCESQQFGGFHYQSTCSELQDHTMFQEGQPLWKEEHCFSEDTANMQQDGASMQGIRPGFPFESNPDVDYPNMLQQFGHQIDDCFQSQRGSIFTNLRMVSPPEYIANPQVVTPTTDLDADDVPELTSPTSCANISMAETLVASEDNPSPSSPTSTTAIDGQSSSSPLSCPACGWGPDITGGNRSPSKLRLAVDKHFKRNHLGQNHPCPACPQSFRNRPDNVKPHVKRKHPEVFMKLYGNKNKTAAAAQVRDQSWPPTYESRAGSNMEAPAGKPAANKRNGRYTRPPRG